MNHKPLTVYDASAGTGKTFTLACEYILLLLNSDNTYLNILAVTFTNKATEEMKIRILSQLYGIGHNLRDSDAYLNKIIELKYGKEQADKTSVKERDEIRRRCRVVLAQLLHDYSNFRIQTIDSFFQTVFRNMAYELNLNSNLKISLKDKQVEDMAVDNIIDQLSPDSNVLRWLKDYAKEKISEDKSWNIISIIKSFGVNIFKDEYKANQEGLTKALDNEEAFKTFITSLRSIKDNSLKQINNIGNEFLTLTNQHGLTPSDFKRGTTGIYGFFLKCAEAENLKDFAFSKTAKDCMTDSGAWINKTAIDPARSTVIALAETSLMPLLATIPDILKEYYTSTIMLANINQLRLLNKIKEEVDKINADTNTFLLSDTHSTLHDIIDGSDTPFIYEKIDATLKHIMIDEFQDTSTTQWENFLVLLKDNIAKGDSHNLIVGDIKQSIYRWRNGDWRMLSELRQNRGPLGEYVESKLLNLNWRSCPLIIQFNNTFFEEAARIEADDVAEIDSTRAQSITFAYKSLRQLIPEPKKNDKDGYVNIQLLYPDEDYTANMLKMVGDTITNLLSHGIRQNEIALLLRDNKEIRLIADYLSAEKPDIRLISTEAYRLDASPTVSFIITVIRHILHPEDLLTKYEVVKFYQMEIVKSGITCQDLLIDHNNYDDITDRDEIKKLRVASLDKWMPVEFLNCRETLSGQPLNEVIERIYQVFNLTELPGQEPYYCLFNDRVTEYANEQSPDITSLLKYWEDELRGKTIESSDTEGIRIMTIHKSKGLEFKHLILPFCDWNINKSNLIWCNTAQINKMPYSYLNVMPVMSSKKMLDSYFSDQYKEEYMQNKMDNLNILYVAFTRAAKSLYIFGQRKKKTKSGKDSSDGNRSVVIEKVLRGLNGNMPEELSHAVLNIPDNEQDTISFECGQPYPIKEEKKNNDKSSDNVFLRDKITLNVTHNSHTNNNIQFRQSNESLDFVDEQTDGSRKERGVYISTGKVMHHLFSTVRTIEDIDRMLMQMETAGVIYNDNLTSGQLREIIAARFANPLVRSWFDPNVKVFNECAIIEKDPVTGSVTEHRPDRVIIHEGKITVIDYKFGNENDKYKEQVKRYMRLLNDMHYENIEGYLWYVMRDKIINVNGNREENGNVNGNGN